MEMLLPLGSLELALKATLVLLLAAGLSAALSARPAADRHLLWLASLLALLALPGATAVAPAWDLPLSAGWYEPAGVGAVPVGGLERGGGVPLETESAVSRGAQAPIGEYHGPPAWLFALWACGAVLVLGWHGLGILAARRMLARAYPCEDPGILAAMEESAKRLGLRGRPPVVLTEALRTPATAGTLRPTVLLPSEAVSWDEDILRSVLLHELAHVRRADLLTHFLGRAACALYWPHPGVWAAARRLRRERERACDDAVLRAGAEPESYAACLLELARRGRASRPLALGALPMAKPAELEGRLLAVLDGRPRGAARPGLVPAVGLALALSLPLAGARAADGDTVPGTPRAAADAAAGPVSTALQEASAPPPAGPGGSMGAPMPEQAPPPSARTSAAGSPTEAGAEGAGQTPSVRVSVRPRSLAEYRGRFLAEARALTMPPLRAFFRGDPAVTEGVLDEVATAAAYDLWWMLVVRITVPADSPSSGLTAWAEGDGRLEIVRGPVERTTAMVSTLAGPLPDVLPRRVRGNAMAAGLRLEEARPGLDAALRLAGAELERRWAAAITGRRSSWLDD